MACPIKAKNSSLREPVFTTHTPVSAATRPDATASTSAWWSRSVCSAEATGLQGCRAGRRHLSTMALLPKRRSHTLIQPRKVLLTRCILRRAQDACSVSNSFFEVIRLSQDQGIGSARRQYLRVCATSPSILPQVQRHRNCRFSPLPVLSSLVLAGCRSRIPVKDRGWCHQAKDRCARSEAVLCSFIPRAAPLYSRRLVRGGDLSRWPLCATIGQLRVSTVCPKQTVKRPLCQT